MVTPDSSVSSSVSSVFSEIIVGTSFTGSTVKVKLLVDTAPSASSALIVMVVEPKALARGVKVIVRFAPLPPITIPEVSIKEAFPEDAVTSTSSTSLSISPMVKLIGPTEASS